MAGSDSVAGNFIPHSNVAFTLPDPYVPAVQRWIVSAKEFFDSHQPATAAASGNANSVIKPFDFGLALGDVIETVMLQYSVKLLPNLGHHNDSLRREVIMLFVQLAAVFDTTLAGSTSSSSATTSGDVKTPTASDAKKHATSKSGDAAAAATSLGSGGIGLSAKAMSLVDAVAADDDVYHAIHTLFGGTRRPTPATNTAKDAASSATPTVAAAAPVRVSGIGESLSLVSLALVSELESHYLHSDSRVRDVAISVTSRLIVENPRVFVKTDNLAAVWNIYFLLDWLSVGRDSTHNGGGSENGAGMPIRSSASSSGAKSLSSPAGTRIAVCEALEVLSPIYSSQQKTLAIQIVSRLVKLPDKSAREVDVVKAVLHRIFTDIAGISDPDNRYCLYFTFLTVLTAHYENYYDILTWAIEDYSKVAYPRSSMNFHLFPTPVFTPKGGSGDGKQLAPAGTAKAATSTSSAVTGSSNTGSTGAMIGAFPKDIVDFYNSLTSHFRAQPALIRYGAALCLYPMLKLYPELVYAFPPLYAYVIAGTLDSHHYTQHLNLTMLQMTSHTFGFRDVVRLCERIKNPFSPLAAASGRRPSMDELVAAAVSVGPNIPPRLLLSLLNTIEHMSKPDQLAQLSLIKHWCRRVDTLDSNFVQRVLPFLHSGDPDLQVSVVDVLRSLESCLPSLSDHLFAGVASYLRSALVDQQKEERVVIVLKAISVFPYERLTEPKLQELLDLLLSKLLHPSSAIRRAVYTLITTASRFWLHKPALTAKAVAILLMTGLSDVNTANVELSVAGLIKLIQSSASMNTSVLGSELLIVLQTRKEELCSRNLLMRLRAYDQIARLFVDDSTASTAAAAADSKAAASAAAGANAIRQQLISSPACVQFTIDLFAATVRSGATTSSVSASSSAGTFALYPHFLALLTTKLNVEVHRRIPVLLLEPLLASTDASIREATAQCWKRACFHFHPYTGAGDASSASTSSSATASVVNLGASIGAGRRVSVVPKVIQAILISLSKMITREHFLELESAFTVLLVLVPYKLKGLNAYLVHKFMPLGLDLIERASTSATLRRVVLLFIEACLRVRPVSCLSHLERFRDRLRELLCTAANDGHELSVIVRVYGVVCYVASYYGDQDLGEAYWKYLQSDLIVAAEGSKGTAKDADPLLANLTPSQLKVVVLSTISALGCMSGPHLAGSIISDLLPFLHHSDATYRSYTVEALNQLTAFMNDSSKDGSTTLALARWSMLPLVSDSDAGVRIAMAEGFTGLDKGSVFAWRLNELRSEEKRPADAGVQKPTRGATRASAAAAAAAAEAAADAKAALPLDVIYEPDRSDWLSDDVRDLLDRTDATGVDEPSYTLYPAWKGIVRSQVTAVSGGSSNSSSASSASTSVGGLVSHSLLVHIQHIIRYKCKSVFPRDDFEQLLFHCSELMKLTASGSAASSGGGGGASSLSGGAALVLSEVVRFASEQKQSLSALNVLLLALDVNITGTNRALLHGCVLGVTNVATHITAPWALQTILTHISGLTVLRDGDLWCLKGVITQTPVMKSPDAIKGNDTIMKSVQKITDHLLRVLQDESSSYTAKTLSLELVAALCLLIPPTDITAVIDYLFTMLEDSSDAAFHAQCGAQLSKLFDTLPKNHPLLHSFMAALKLDARNPRMATRLRALTTLSVLHSQLDRQTRSYELLRLFADPTFAVRTRALSLVLDGTLEPNLCLLLLPSIKRIGGETTGEGSSVTAVPEASLDTMTDEQLQNVADTENARAQQSGTGTGADGAPGAGGGGEFKRQRSTSGDRKVSLSRPPSSGGQSALDIPLANTDPTNNRYFRSPPFLRLLFIYRLTSTTTGGALVPNSEWAKLFQSAPAPRPITARRADQPFADTSATAAKPSVGDVKGAPAGSSLTVPGVAANATDAVSDDENPALTPLQRRQLIADIRAKRCVTASKEYNSLLAIAMKQEPVQTDALIDELVKSITHVKDALFNEDEKHHDMSVLLSLLHCYPRLERKYGAVQSLQLTCLKYKAECDELRANIVSALTEVAFSKPRVGVSIGGGGLASPNRLPIVNALAHEKRTSRSISLLPTPITVAHNEANEKLKIIARSRELEANSRAYHARLSQIVRLELELVEALGKLITNKCAEFTLQNLYDTCGWLMGMLDDSHTHVRVHVRRTLVALANGRAIPYVPPAAQSSGSKAVPANANSSTVGAIASDQSPNGQFTVYLQRLILDCYKLVNADSGIGATSTAPISGGGGGGLLRRRKVDRLFLLAHLSRFTHTPNVRHELIHILIRCWDDLDGFVIDSALDLTRFLLCDEKTPEIVAFATATGSAAASSSGAAVPPTPRPGEVINAAAAASAAAATANRMGATSAGGTGVGRRSSVSTSTAASAAAAPLIQAISQRMREPAYAHKHKLSALLQSIFT